MFSKSGLKGRTLQLSYIGLKGIVTNEAWRKTNEMGLEPQWG